MTPDAFAVWIASAKASRQWTQRHCADALGVDPGQIVRWKARGAPAYIALAIAAIEAGLPPWRLSESHKLVALAERGAAE